MFILKRLKKPHYATSFFGRNVSIYQPKKLCTNTRDNAQRSTVTKQANETKQPTKSKILKALPGKAHKRERYPQTGHSTQQNRLTLIQLAHVGLAQK